MVRPSDNKCFASEFKLWVMELSDIHRSMFYPLSRAKLLPQVTCFFFYFCFTCFLIILSIPRKIPRKRTNINLEITIHRTYIRGDRTWRSAIARFEIVCWIWSRRTKIPTYIFPFRKSTWNEIRGFSLKNPWATIRWNKRAWKHLAWNSVS